MKLLDKKEVNASKALERKLEVEEGAKLAKRVDGLRELSAREEESLRRFKDAAVEAAKAEIGFFIGKRDKARDEAKEAEHLREVAMRPVYLKEAELESREVYVKAIEKALSERKEGADSRDLELSLRLEECRAAEQKAGAVSDRARKFHDQALKKLQEADEKLQEADNALAAARSEAKSVQEGLELRKGSMLGMEETLRAQYAHAAAEEERLSILERAIIDREQQLEREVGRRSQ